MMFPFIKYHCRFSLGDPVLVEGLPGPGNIGMLVTDYLIDHLKARKIMSVVVPHLAPGCLIDDDSIIEPAALSFYRARKTKNRDRDIILLLGDISYNIWPGNMTIIETLASIVERFGINELITFLPVTSNVKKNKVCLFNPKLSKSSSSKLIPVIPYVSSFSHIIRDRQCKVTAISVNADISTPMGFDLGATELALRKIVEYLGIKNVDIKHAIRDMESLISQTELAQNQSMLRAMERAVRLEPTYIG